MLERDSKVMRNVGFKRLDLFDLQQIWSHLLCRLGFVPISYRRANRELIDLDICVDFTFTSTISNIILLSDCILIAYALDIGTA